MTQLSLFNDVATAYIEAEGRPLDTRQLYESVARRTGLCQSDIDVTVPIGKAGIARSPFKRRVRWHMQTLKALGIIERVDNARGVWRLTDAASGKLHQAASGIKMVAFSTDLGVAIWGSCSALQGITEPIALYISSPPYLLAKPRAYGGPVEADYVDFICKSLEPIVRALVPGGSICLNVGNDVFVKGTPSRSMYCERLLLALADRFDLSLMDRMVWHNPCKPPGPIQWASKARVQLNVSYEHIFWLTNDPMKVRADNRRVLEPHSAKHLALIEAGGEKRFCTSGDGAYRIKPGSFSGATDGRIQKNMISRSHVCKDSAQYRKDAKALGFPVHGAMQPLSIPEFLIKFLSEVGDLVVDNFGGTFKTAMAAEKNGRRWISTEINLEYVRPSIERFRGCKGFWMNPGMEAVTSAPSY
jgi:site-specific DNA-methyltransferase (cytosine-N4-specific)